MAITEIEYTLFRQLREQGALPLGGDILELGEANWYGDVAVDRLAQDIYRFARENDRKDLFLRLDRIVRDNLPSAPSDLAKIYWRVFWQPASLTAIDFHGTETALKLDLNKPLSLPAPFHAVLNLGTAEHVFNIAQLFKTVHDFTRADGLMVHGLPFSGWVDHGFYSFNPTFYWDLAAANDYTVLSCLYAELEPAKLVQLHHRESVIELVKTGQLGENSLIYTVFRKAPQDTEFRIPIQGYYADALSAEAKQAWKMLR